MAAVTPEPVTKLIEAFSQLPGIGPKTASRLTFYLLRRPEEQTHILAGPATTSPRKAPVPSAATRRATAR